MQYLIMFSFQISQCIQYKSIVNRGFVIFIRFSPSRFKNLYRRTKKMKSSSIMHTFFWTFNVKFFSLVTYASFLIILVDNFLYLHFFF